MFEPVVTKDGHTYLKVLFVYFFLFLLFILFYFILFYFISFHFMLFFLIFYLINLPTTDARYERIAILQWFESGHKTSPLTNQPLMSCEIIPVFVVKNMITAFLEKNGIV
jgi:U-box domain